MKKTSLTELMNEVLAEIAGLDLERVKPLEWSMEDVSEDNFQFFIKTSLPYEESGFEGYEVELEHDEDLDLWQLAFRAADRHYSVELKTGELSRVLRTLVDIVVWFYSDDDSMVSGIAGSSALDPIGFVPYDERRAHVFARAIERSKSFLMRLGLVYQGMEDNIAMVKPDMKKYHKQ